VFRDKRVSCLQVAGVLPGSKVEPTLVGLMTKVGLCPVLERMVIFDSLVSDFQHDVSAVTDRRYRGIRNVVEQSQQKLNCALFVKFL
jgi:hypothetical protein